MNIGDTLHRFDALTGRCVEHVIIHLDVDPQGFQRAQTTSKADGGIVSHLRIEDSNSATPYGPLHVPCDECVL